MLAAGGLLAACLLLLGSIGAHSRLVVFSQQVQLTGMDPSAAASLAPSQDDEHVPALQQPRFSWLMWGDQQQQQPRQQPYEDGLTVEEAMLRSVGCSRLHAAMREYQSAQLLDHLLAARTQLVNTHKMAAPLAHEELPLHELDALEAAAATTADYDLASMSNSHQHHSQAANAASHSRIYAIEQLLSQSEEEEQQQTSGQYVDMIDGTDAPQPDLRSDMLLSRHYDQDTDYAYADSSLQSHGSVLQVMTHVLDTLLSKAEAALRLDNDIDGVDYDQYYDMDTTLGSDTVDAMDSADALDTLDDWASNPLLRTSYWSLSRQPTQQQAEPVAAAKPSAVLPHEATEDECQVGLVLLVCLLLATAFMMVGFIRNAVALRHAMVAGPSTRRDLLLPLVFEHEGRQYMVLLDEAAVQGSGMQHSKGKGKGKGNWGPANLQDEKAQAQADWKQSKDQTAEADDPEEARDI